MRTVESYKGITSCSKAFVLLATLPLTAMAAPVVEGVYVSGTNNNKRVHLSSFEYEGAKHYELFLANMIGDSSFVIASKAKPIQDSQTVVLRCQRVAT